MSYIAGCSIVCDQLVYSSNFGIVIFYISFCFSWNTLFLVFYPCSRTNNNKCIAGLSNYANISLMISLSFMVDFKVIRRQGGLVRNATPTNDLTGLTHYSSNIAIYTNAHVLVINSY